MLRHRAYRAEALHQRLNHRGHLLLGHVLESDEHLAALQPRAHLDGVPPRQVLILHLGYFTVPLLLLETPLRYARDITRRPPFRLKVRYLIFTPDSTTLRSTQ